MKFLIIVSSVWFIEVIEERDPLILDNEMSTWAIDVCDAKGMIAVGSNAHSISIWRIAHPSENSEPPQKRILTGHQHNVPAISIFVQLILKHEIFLFCRIQSMWRFSGFMLS